MCLKIEKPSSITFWNYIKQKDITLYIKECPYCHSKCDIYIKSSVFSGWIQCSECGIRGTDYRTDSGQYRDFGIERAVNKWNNHLEDYFFMEDPENYYLYSQTLNKLLPAKKMICTSDDKTCENKNSAHGCGSDDCINCKYVSEK